MSTRVVLDLLYKRGRIVEWHQLPLSTQWTNTSHKMKMLVCILALIGAAVAGRLENTYLPPQGASQAGGQNLPLPLRTVSQPSSNYLPPQTHTTATFTQKTSSYQQAPVAPTNTYLPPQQATPSPPSVADLRLQGASGAGPFGAQSSFGSQSSVGSQSAFGSQPSLGSQSSFGSKSSLGSQSAFGSQPSLGSQSSFGSKSSLGSQSAFGSQPSLGSQSAFGSQPSLGSQSSFGSKSSLGSQSTYGSQSSFGSQSSLGSQSSFGSQSSLGSQSYSSQGIGARQGPTPRPVGIIKQANENNGDGSYTFSYETEDGISAQEQGQLRQDGAEGIESVQGSYSYTGPDNVRYSVTYTADENGFMAYGDHLPTPPPIPEAILRSLEINAREEAEALRSSNQEGYQQQQQGYQQGQGYQQQGYQQRQSYQQQGYQSNQGYQYNAPSASNNGGY